MQVKTKSIIDWISVTVKSGKLAVSDWVNEYKVNEKGMLGYNLSIEYADGRIELANTNRPDMGNHIIYSGSCLRKMEEMYAMDAINIVKFHGRQGHKFTRLDIAVDITDGLIAEAAIDRYEGKQCETKLRKGGKVQEIDNPGATLYIGRRGGDRFVRIYDKAAEQRQEGVWTRVEGEFRSFGAVAVVEKLIEAKDGQKAISAILRGTADFPYWAEWKQAMSGDKEVLDIGRKVTNSTEEWLLKKVAPSLAKFSLDNEGFLDKFAKLVNEMMEERRLTEKDQIL